MEFLWIVGGGAIGLGLYGIQRLISRGIATAQRHRVRAPEYGPPLTARDRALRYPGPPFDHVGMRNTYRLRTTTLDGVPVSSFGFRFLGDRNPAMADLSWRYYDVVTLALPTRLPTLKVVRTGFLFTPGRNGPLKRVRTGDARFDEDYAVYTDIPAFAVEAIGPDLRQWMVQAVCNEWLIQDTEIVSWHYSYTDEDTVPVAQYLRSLLARMPDIVWQRVGVDPRVMHPVTPGPWRPGQPNGQPQWALRAVPPS